MKYTYVTIRVRRLGYDREVGYTELEVTSFDKAVCYTALCALCRGPFDNINGFYGCVSCKAFPCRACENKFLAPFLDQDSIRFYRPAPEIVATWLCPDCLGEL